MSLGADGDPRHQDSHCQRDNNSKTEVKNLKNNTEVVKTKEIENLDRLITDYIGFNKSDVSGSYSPKVNDVDDFNSMDEEIVDDEDFDSYESYNHRLRLRNISKHVFEHIV